MSAASRILRHLQLGPSTASDVYDELERNGVPRTSARPALSKLVGSGRVRSSRLALGHNDSVVTVGEFKSPALLKQLLDTDFKGRSGLAILVAALRAERPVVGVQEAAKLCVARLGAGSEADWGEVRDLLDALAELGIVRPVRQAEETLWVLNKPLFAEAGLTFSNDLLNPGKLALQRVAATKLSVVIADWLTKNTFTSSGGTTHATPTLPVVFRGSAFDIVGFSYARGIAERSGKIRPAPLVGDILVDYCGKAFARSLVARVKNTWTISEGAGHPVPFVLARGFDPDAFALLKKEGVLVWTHAQLLGERVADAIEKLTLLIDALVSSRAVDPALFGAIFDGLDSYRTLFGHLKGTLFEMMMAHYFREIGYDTKLAWAVDDFDVDVFARRANEGVIVECKGYAANHVVPLGEVKRHFTRRFPRAREIAGLSQADQLRSYRAVVATTAEAFEPEVLEAQSNGDLNARRDSIHELWNRDRVLQGFREAGLETLAGLVDRYYRAVPA